jgi:hypothetical protein
MRYDKLFADKTPILVTSEGEYSKIHFEDGSSCVAAYTHKELGRRFGINLKMVRRGVYADMNHSELTAKGIKILNKEYTFSRRISKVLAIMFLMFFCFDSFSQNIAPVAKNDTINGCNNNGPTFFNVLANDTDANGDRLRLNYFSEPPFGNLVSESNTGRFRYQWSAGVATTTFQYNARDVKFANIGSLTSNMATVIINGSSPYYYTGTYTGVNSRETCRSINTTAVNISGTTRETNVAYQSIILDAKNGVVTIAPTAGGSVEFKIK